MSGLATVSAEVIGGMVDAAEFAALIVSLALLIPHLAVGFRRLHDIDRSGWWVPALAFVAFAALLASGWIGIGIALVAVLVLLAFFATPGTQGPNQFGPDPYGGNELE